MFLIFFIDDAEKQKKREEKAERKRKEKESLKNRNKILISEPSSRVKGHTGYLTFATCNKTLGKAEGGVVKDSKEEAKE